jgi:hypothetical protein
LVREHSKGEVETPTELDVIMKEDAEFLINDRYDNLEGAEKMLELVSQMKNSPK